MIFSTSIIQNIILEQQNIIPERTILFEMSSSVKEEVLVIADFDRISQVLTNYISNAHKYSEKEKPIRVRLEVEDQVTSVSVYDEGLGLSHKDQEKVWERFYQNRQTKVLNGSGIGLGLGLYICRTIIEQHQGNVGVQSRLGEGSVFWFTLPLAKKTTEDDSWK